MTTMIKCISPVDGACMPNAQALSAEAADAAVAPRACRPKEWLHVPLDKGAGLFWPNCGAERDEGRLVPELAWQMGALSGSGANSAV